MTRPIRLLKLVQLLAGQRRYHVGEIAERFGVTERTVYRDLAELSTTGIPVVNDEYGYRLLDTATIRPLALDAAEQAVLKLLLGNPATQPSPDVTRTLKSVEAKLDAATLEAEETPRALTLAGPERSGPIPDGLTSLLERAIRDRIPISIHYRSLAGGRLAWRGVDPYEMFHRENAWYLVGRCHLHDEPRTFRLDRIAEAKRLAGVFRRPIFNIDAFLENTWAVYRGRTLYDIVIHFDASLGPLIQQGVHHATERVTRLGNGHLEYRVQLSHLEEVARWIVSFAGLARAIAPGSLVTLVRDIAGRARDAHDPDARPPDTRSQRPLPGLPTLDEPADQPPLI